jgi:predicted metal-dependent hydrolase
MQIPRRDVTFDIDPAVVPRDWCNADGFETTFLNALSALFPEGEKFFVESVKQQKHLITDPELQREVIGFIGQEAMHGREHRAFNDILIAHGYAEAPRIEAGLRVFLKRVRKVLPPMSQLAVTCALEHFTAMLAERLLSDPTMRDQMHPAVQRLWLWHALEESEHKSVAFDVYRTAGGSYARRIAIMLLTTVFFFAVVGLVHARLMATRKILWKPWTWARSLTRMWIYPGFFMKLAPAYVAYFRPSFHPSDRDTQKLIAMWQVTLFGTTAA